MDATNEIMNEQQYKETVARAAREFLDRKARRSHPKGGQGSCGKWWPDDDELMHHCRTADHVADLMGVDPSDVRRRARELAKQGY